MKLLIFIILILNLSLSTSFSAEKKDCSKFKKFTPLTTLPALISKHGIILFVNIVIMFL